MANRSHSRYEEMLKRKIHFPDQFKGAGDSRIQSVIKQDGGKIIEIIWQDGTKSRFHSIWLRHTCHCSSCKVDVSGQPIVDISSIPETSYIQDTDTSEEKVLKIMWSEGNCKHEGFLPTAYLKYYTYSDGQLERNRITTRIKFTSCTEIPEMEYKAVMETQSGLYKWLKILGDQGLCLIKNVPDIDQQSKQVANRVSYVQHTIYGETFDVKAVPNASNAAYRNIALGLHMDQPTYESPPGIQFLHCRRFDDVIEGGESIFVDIHHIVDVFRQEHPHEFETLCNIPTTFETIGYQEASGRKYPVHLQIQRPIITRNRFGDVITIAFHENLLGPLQVPEEDVESYYKAYRLLVKAVHGWPYLYRKRLQAGEMMTFQNRRVLHGRTAFVSNGGERMLQGTYVNIDEFRSMLTYLHNTVGDGSLLGTMG